MSLPAITVDNLSKKYRLNHQAEPRRYTALRDVIAQKAKQLFRLRVGKRPNWDNCSIALTEDFWALKDVSFEVNQGEVVGFIGRNGAGKSTLLKILSRITEPTSGRVRIRGRVASLLEVGTGFHPELTGRENIYLNGAILGMTHADIKRRFDEIVAFAEVEQFLDTPVKRYSSGMYVRLAFAVAAHLEPDILVVDEVLAVGDSQFQKKCLGKMESVARDSGRTILFVSHNMAAVLNICTRAVVLCDGRVVNDSDVRSAVQSYLGLLGEISQISLNERTDRSGSQRLRFVSYHLRNERDEPVDRVYSGQSIRLAFRYRSRDGAGLRNVHAAVGFHGQFDEYLFNMQTCTAGDDFDELPAEGELVCSIPEIPLQPGTYHFHLWCTVNGEVSELILKAGSVEVHAGDFFGSGRLPPSDRGPFLVKHSWTINSNLV